MSEWVCGLVAGFLACWGAGGNLACGGVQKVMTQQAVVNLQQLQQGHCPSCLPLALLTQVLMAVTAPCAGLSSCSLTPTPRAPAAAASRSPQTPGQHPAPQQQPPMAAASRQRPTEARALGHVPCPLAFQLCASAARLAPHMPLLCQLAPLPSCCSLSFSARQLVLCQVRLVSGVERLYVTFCSQTSSSHEKKAWQPCTPTPPPVGGRPGGAARPCPRASAVVGSVLAESLL